MSHGELTEPIELLFEADGSDEGWVGLDALFRERLNEPYELALTLASEETAARTAERLLGKRAKLAMVRGGTLRQVTGVVFSVETTSEHRVPDVSTKITIGPALEALRHRVDTRIFQEKTVPEILEEVLGAGLGAYDSRVDNRLGRAYRLCDFRAQYDESDLAFCHRLMEEEGIAYWFDFGGETETLVLADRPGAFGTVEGPDAGPIGYRRGVAEHLVSELIVGSRIGPTKIATRHFDWRAPSAPHEGESTDGPDGGPPNGATLEPAREVYHHDSRPLTVEPGGTTYAADKQDQVGIRRERQRLQARTAHGASRVLDMRVAAKFELAGHTQADLDGEYLVLGVTHRLSAAGRDYENRFWCVPANTVYRPPIVTPKPRMPSIQTATVVGPGGEEIHTDEHGRIKVQFHWDRHGTMDERSSCWLRVQQAWAGAAWGFVFIPRIGMEVVVDFVNGDPDLPMVLGCVYNGEHRVPYPLPEEKTKSTIKSASSLGGGGYNELRFEDKAGSEEVFIHAQKDLNEVVENDHTTTVHHDQHIRVDNDQTQEIGNDQTEHVFANQDLTVDANRTIAVHGNFTETIDGSETKTVSSGVTETIDAGETRTVTGGMRESITGDRSQTIVGSSNETITGTLGQTITGGAKIVTPATFNLTAVGGLKIAATAGTKIMTNTFTLVAQGGNTHHDAWWSFFARKWNDNYAYKLDYTPFALDTSGINIGVNAGAYLQTRGFTGGAALVHSKTWTINGDTKGELTEAAAVEAEFAAARSRA